MAVTTGRLLVATPPLEDPNFDRSVVFVIEHSPNGALGVVINRVTIDSLEAPLDRWAALQTPPAQLFAGGPVEPDALIALARRRHPAEHKHDGATNEHDVFTPVTNDIVSADLMADPAILTDVLDAVRIFRGYSGWGAGQLEDELEAGAWLVVDLDTDDVFTADPDGLWRRVLARQEGRLAWLANAPDDLSLN